ncbi:MAG: cupredoxin domain-containing protein [Acidimicrobiales bacterium]
MKHARPFLVAAAFGFGALLVACGGQTAAPYSVAGSPNAATVAAAGVSPRGPVGAVVTLDYASFEPSVVKIHEGQAVEWQWQGRPIPYNVDIPHVASSPTQDSGVWYHTFYHPGIYRYRCDLHQHMVGEVLVLP